MKKYLSLGNLCEVAYQIDRFTKQEGHYFFDSLIVEDDSYKSILDDASNFFLPENWVLSNSATLLDKESSLKFMHEFELLPGAKDPEGRNVINAELIEAYLPIARQKFTYLKEKTLNIISDLSNEVFLIRREDIYNVTDALSRLNDIKSTFGHLNPRMKFVLLSNYCDEEVIEGDSFFLNISRANIWSEDNDSWDRIFEIINK